MIQQESSNEAKKRLHRLNQKLIKNDKKKEQLLTLYESIIEKSDIKSTNINGLIQRLSRKTTLINNEIESTIVLNENNEDKNNLTELKQTLPNVFEIIKKSHVKEILENNKNSIQVKEKEILEEKIRHLQVKEKEILENNKNSIQVKEKEILEEKIRHLQVEQIKKNYEETMIFYVCSYGGCGSWMLCEYLKNFGKVFHIHSKNPPKKLCYVNNEWFNIEQIEKIENYTIIYIYKNPIHSIFSRFIQNNDILSSNTQHLNNIQCPNVNVTLKSVLDNKNDLYEMEQFYDNYTKTDNERNYQIYCVKYEDFWENIKIFNETINIPDKPELYPHKNETARQINTSYIEILNEIYSPLIEKMNGMQFIEIR